MASTPTYLEAAASVTSPGTTDAPVTTSAVSAVQPRLPATVAEHTVPVAAPRQPTPSSRQNQSQAASADNAMSSQLGGIHFGTASPTTLDERKSQLLAVLAELARTPPSPPPSYTALKEFLVVKYGTNAFEDCKGHVMKTLLQVSPPVDPDHTVPSAQLEPAENGFVILTTSPASDRASQAEVELAREKQKLADAQAMVEQTRAQILARQKQAAEDRVRAAVRAAAEKKLAAEEKARFDAEQEAEAKRLSDMEAAMALARASREEAERKTESLHREAAALKEIEKIAIFLETQPADFVPDSDRLVCRGVGCRAKFGMRIWKHHCRVCGDIFCDTCTSKRLEFSWSESPCRACEPCYAAEQAKRAEVVGRRAQGGGACSTPSAWSLDASDGAERARAKAMGAVYVVTGAGSGEVNGYYKKHGAQGGFDQFAKMDPDGSTFKHTGRAVRICVQRGRMASTGGRVIVGLYTATVVLAPMMAALGEYTQRWVIAGDMTQVGMWYSHKPHALTALAAAPPTTGWDSSDFTRGKKPYPTVVEL